MQRIVVTDKDGVEVLKAGENADHDPAATSILTTIFSQTAQQSEKVEGLGKTQSVLLSYDRCYVLQIGMEMLVISILAGKDAKIGTIMALVPSLKDMSLLGLQN
ncbi:lamtor3-b [Symbiodinium natans]|uniref:Lamtor3-b protein n=1 Tax=Symbiodinium natans TaxID=878477 RepID=A0A812QB63_9DINO|nr:lamtor3-b [Symbiodinium natans]